ncbi:MAG: iron-containing alcohol dehydrogenase [Clostridia bacterium]|nr:iron-containing alcohol dehydrogenase [Clostridia bacterium]
MNFNCYMPTRVISGEGCLLKNAMELKKLGSRALLVTGKHAAAASGALDEMKTALAENGITYVHFDEIRENPLLITCHRAGEIAKAEGCDFVVAIGGGSVQDAGKAIAAFAANDLQPEEIYDFSKWEKALKIAAVGTTAGTGSEVTAVSVLTRENGQKKSITRPVLYASLAFADARYTASCGRELTFSTAIDAVSHALEAYFSAKSGDYSDGCALQALRLLVPALNECAQTAVFTKSIREDLYAGSLWAGLALNACGTCFPHPFGYLLTEQFGLPHGYACGVFLPEFIARAAKYAPQKADRLERETSLSLNETARLIQKLTAHLQFGLTEELISAAAERFDGARNLLNSPGGFSKEETVALLRSKM